MEIDTAKEARGIVLNFDINGQSGERRGSRPLKIYESSFFRALALLMDSGILFR